MCIPALQYIVQTQKALTRQDSCPRWVNASNKNTPSLYHTQRQNVTTCVVRLKKMVTCAKKKLTKTDEPSSLAEIYKVLLISERKTGAFVVESGM